jgi:hypothetical protein
MRIKPVYIFLYVLIFCLSCDRNTIKNQDGKLITHSLCKNEKQIVDTTAESCVEYSYNRSGEILSLKHINAGFNCCPEKLYCNITIENDTIFLEELERSQSCNCLCLYDMETEVYGVKAQTYIVKYMEPYLYQEDELVFEINLQQTDTGTYCVDRLNYPWGM